MFQVIKNDNTYVLVTIMKRKLDNKYQFINISKGHICTCVFDTIKDTINDLIGKNIIRKSNIISYLQNLYIKTE